MRTLRVIPLVAGAAILAACGGDSNGPSNSAPTAAFTVACSNLDCTFTDGSTDADGTVSARSWDFGDGQTSTQTSPQHSFGANGTFSVKLTVTDNAGATGSVTKSVTVPNLPPSADFTLACTNLACDFTNISSDADGSVASYAWDFGDPTSAQNSATTKDASHTFSAAGTFPVKLTVTDNGGASGTITTQVTVTAASAGGVQAGFSVACASLDCTITNTTTGLGTVVTWAWDFGDGQTSNVQNPAPVHYSVTAPTTLTITLVVTSDGVTSQATKSVRVAPPASLTCNGAACTLLIEQNATVQVTLQSVDCQAHGNLFRITAPIVDTLFADGCFATPGTQFNLDNNGTAVFNAGTQLDADVTSGVIGAVNPQLQVTGDFANGWTLAFDDGFVGPGEPDFNDLIILIKATPAP